MSRGARKAGAGASARLEGLERRLCLSLVQWTGAGDGESWHDGWNWSTGSPPGLLDDALIDVATDPTITFGTLAGDSIIRSLVSRENLSFTGGSLSVTTTAEVSAVVGLDGGRLVGGSWDVSAGAMRASRATTSLAGGMVLTGDIDMTADHGTHIVVEGGLTHRGTIRATLGARVEFWGDQQYRAGVIELDASRLEIKARLELAADVTVRLTGAAGALGNDREDQGTLVNRGSIVGGTSDLRIELGRLENAGSITSGPGAELEILAQQWSNTGTLQVSGSTLEVESEWSNPGLLDAIDSLVLLGGSYSTADLGVGRFSRSGGNLVLGGSIDNTGDTLRIADNLVDAILRGASITGGEIAVPSGSQLDVESAWLFGPLTINGDVLVGGTSGPRTLELLGDAQVNGVLRLDNGSTVKFWENDAPAVSVIEVLPNAESVQIVTSGATKFGPDVSILLGARSETFLFGGAGDDDVLTNEGLISLAGSWATLEVAGRAFVNSGTIRAGADARLELETDQWTNHGDISAFDARWVYLGDSESVWRNDGQVTLMRTELHLEGRVTTADLGWDGFTVADTDVILGGTLDNTGNSFELGPQTGVWTFFNGGGVQGGELIVTLGYEPVFQGGRLTGPISVVGNLLLAGGSLRVAGGLDVDGSVILDDGSIEFEGSQTVGSAALRFMGAGGTLRLTGAAPVVTLEAGVSVLVDQGATATFRDASNGTDGTIVSQGLISVSDESGTLTMTQHGFDNQGRLAVDGPVEIDTDVWSSPGEIDLISGALEVTDAVALTAEINFAGITRGEGVIRFSGTLDNTGEAIELDAAVWRFEFGALIGGVVHLLGELSVAGASAIVGPIELHGDVRVGDDSGATLTLSGGLTLDGTIVLGEHGHLGFEGSQTIDSGTIEISGLGESNLIRIDGNDSVVTLGASVVLRGGHAATTTIQSYGSLQRLINYGEIRAEGGGRGIEIRTRTFENHGLLFVGPGATLGIAAAWSSTGLVQVQEGALRLGGVFASDAVNLAGFSRSGGTISMTGEMDNTGRTFAPAQAIGPFILDGGVIVGGIVDLPSNHLLRVGTHQDSELRGPMQFDGSITTQWTPGARLTITGGLTMTGRLVLAEGARVYLEGTQTIHGAEFQFADAGAPAQLLTAGVGATVVLGGGTSITGGHPAGAMIGSEGAQTLVLEGALYATTAGAGFYVLPSTFINRGEVFVSNQSNVYVTASGSYSGGALLSGKWSVMERSTLRIAGATIVTIGEDAEVLLMGFQPVFIGLSPGLSEIRGTFTLGEETHWEFTPATGTLINSGAIILRAASALDITGDYVQTETGLFDSTIDANLARYPGFIRVSGSATIDGSFVMHYERILPYEGESLEVITASGGVQGAFASVTLPEPIDDTDQVLLIVDADRVRVFNTDLADFNLDGKADTQDFIYFLGLWSAGDDRADTNGDGIVDSRDFLFYLTWWTDG